MLDEWDWLVGGASGEGTLCRCCSTRAKIDTIYAVTISQLIPIPTSSIPKPLIRTPHAASHPFDPPPSSATPQDFVMLTSDGRAYVAHWGPSATAPISSPLSRPLAPANSSDILFDEKAELKQEIEDEANKWIWSGVCFHPPTLDDGEASLDEQDHQLDLGKGASTADLNLKMGLIAIGCEESVSASYARCLTDSSCSAEPSQCTIFRLRILQRHRLDPVSPTSSHYGDHSTRQRLDLPPVASPASPGLSFHHLQAHKLIFATAGLLMATRSLWDGRSGGQSGLCLVDWDPGPSLDRSTPDTASKARRVKASKITL